MLRDELPDWVRKNLVAIVGYAREHQLEDKEFTQGESPNTLDKVSWPNFSHQVTLRGDQPLAGLVEERLLKTEVRRKTTFYTIAQRGFVAADKNFGIQSVHELQQLQFHIHGDQIIVGDISADSSQIAIGAGASAVQRPVDVNKQEIREEIAHESPEAQRWAFERSNDRQFWLTFELLEPKLDIIVQEFSDLKQGNIHRPFRDAGLAESLDWMERRIGDLDGLIDLLGITFKYELAAAYGKPWRAGDALSIKQSVDGLLECCHDLLEWETDLYFIRFPPALSTVRSMMQGWAEEQVLRLQRILRELKMVISDPPPKGTEYTITYTFEGPENVNEVLAEIGKLKEL